MARRVERVVIVGRDAAAWLTALGLHRAYGRLGVHIELIELPSRLGPADVFAATPALRGLHTLLGLPEAALYQACGAMPSLGQRFVDWSGDAAAFLNAYDVRQPAIDDIPFEEAALIGAQPGAGRRDAACALPSGRAATFRDAALKKEDRLFPQADSITQLVSIDWCLPRSGTALSYTIMFC